MELLANAVFWTAVLANLTALQRALHVRQQARLPADTDDPRRPRYK